MTNKPYIPVSCDFHDELLNEAVRKNPVRIHYFEGDNEWKTAGGIIKDVYSKNKEEFLLIEGHPPIRLDTILTLNGSPGPAFDTYEGLSNACMDCRDPLDPLVS